MSKIKPLGEGYVEKTYQDAHPDDRKITTWRYYKDPHGTFVDNKTGEKYSRVETQGLPETVINAEDSDMLGDRVRIWTQEPPPDTGMQEDIVDGIMDLDDTHVDNLHPDNWKKLTADQRGEILKEVNKVLQEELGVEYDFEVTNQADRPGLGGSFTPGGEGGKGKIKINAAGDAFSDPRTAIRTIVHEARHAYQDAQADAKGNDYQQMCQYNNDNYVSSRTDYVQYGEQFIERDSRTFGHNTANRLIDSLNDRWGH